MNVSEETECSRPGLATQINENIQMNQILSGVDIQIERGNPKAIGVYGRAAQGTSIQDVVIRSVDAAIGLQGGAGSGGSHINVRVEGGVVGMDLSTAQPSPTLTGATLINQTGSALVYNSPGRQTLSVTGLSVVRAAGAMGPAVSSTAEGISLVDCVLEDPSGTGSVAVSATGSLFMKVCNTARS